MNCRSRPNSRGSGQARFACDKLRHGVGREPGPARHLVAKPGDLPLGVAAGVALAALGRLRRGRSRRRDAAAARARRGPSSPAASDRGRARPAPAPRPARRPPAWRRTARRSGGAARRGRRREKPSAPRPGSRIAGMPSRCQSASERPVASSTSSARAIRVRSPGISRARHRPDRGAASSACSGGRALGLAAARAPRRGSRAASAAPPKAPASAP